MRKLTCHCGAIEIEINLKDGLTNLKRCNCSMCKRKGVILKNINKEDLKIIKGVNNNATNNGLLKTFFSICNFSNPARNKRIINKYPLSK